VPPDQPRHPDDLLRVAAEFVAAQSGSGWRHLMAVHAPDVHGNCWACRHVATGAAPTWPCRLAVIAQEAERISRPPDVRAPRG